MPTPTHVFADVAATYGGVDAGDMEAVQRWYEETLPASLTSAALASPTTRGTGVKWCN